MRIKTALAAVAGALVAVPAAASAATIVVAPHCYLANRSGGQTIQISGSGFTPNSTATVTGNHGFLAQSTTDGSGNFIAQGQTPYLGFQHPGAGTLKLTARDNATSQNAPTISVPIAQAGVDLAPTTAKPKHKVTWRFAGLQPGKKVYGLWRFHGSLKGRKLMGKGHGACGLLKSHSHFIEGNTRYGTWVVTFDYSKHFRPHKILAGFKITVRKVFG
jgi:hypothetical protein